MSTTGTLSAFAILGLPAFADPTRIRKAATAVAMRERLSGSGTGDAAKRAAERLGDPLTWLRDSLRWLVLPDDALSGFSVPEGEFPAEVASSLALLAERQSTRQMLAHNLAVIASARALATGEASDAISAMNAACEASQQRGFMQGIALPIAGAPCASLGARVDDEVRRLADPRLTGTEAQKALQDYVVELVRPVLAGFAGRITALDREALRRLNEGCKKVERHIDRPGAMRQALLGPTLEYCSHAIGSFSARQASTKSKEEHGALGAEVRAQLESEVSAVVACGDDAGSAAQRIRDSYAELLRSIAIRGCNEFRMFGDAEAMLTRARDVASAAVLRRKLEEDIGSAAEASVAANCVYCKVADADGTPVVIPMYRVTERVWNGVKYQSLKAPVPRCKTCQERQETRDSLNRWILIGGAVLGLTIGVGIASKRDWIPSCFGGACIGAVGGLVLTIVIGFFRGLSEAGGPRDFPPIAGMLREGWKFGEKPGKHD